MKIANKIILSTAILFALAMAAIGYFTGMYSTGVVRDRIYSYLKSSNRARAEHVRTFLNDQKETSEILAAASVYLDLLKTPKDSPQYPVVKDKIDKRFIRTLQINKNILELYILDTEGGVVAASDKEEEGESRSEDLFFTQAKQDTYIKSIYDYDGLDKLVYTISSPIKDNNGTFLGVSVLMFSQELLNSIVASENGLGNTEENFLINEEQYFITPSLFLGQGVVLKQKVETINANKCFDKNEIEYVKKNGYSGLKSNEVIISAKDYRGVDIIGVHAYIPETGWCLITKVDESTLNKDVINITIINFFVLLISLISLIFLVYILVYRITSGIKKLEKNIKEIERGNFEGKIDTGGKDEIGELLLSFSNMTNTVKNSRKDVDKKVEEQTKELKEKADKMDEQQKAILNILEDVEEEKVKAQKLAAIVKDSNEAILVKDLNGIIIEWNEGAENLYGWSADEIIGKSIKLIVPPEKYKEVDNIFKKVVNGERIEHYSTTRIKKDGHKVDVSISVSPIKDATGNVNSVSVIALDVTKEMQIDKAKTEFVSLASHQLRTPLSTINWYTEMLLGGDAGKISKKQKEFLEQIYTGNKRMVDLVNALLNVSRLELGTLAIEPEMCDLQAIAKQVIADVLPQMKEKSQIFIEDYAKNLSTVSADKKLVDIIFQNLLSNAMKYTPEKGQIKLSISKDKENFIISVDDNGMGIPKDSQNKIFTKLYRADNVREKDTVGTGLGLYMVKSILDQSGGKIWFESKDGKGTTFFVTIPISGMKKREGTKKLS